MQPIHIKAEILRLRNAIRYHRDQKGDDRCWLDDDWLWSLLPGGAEPPKTLPSYEEMMSRCGAFYRDRRADQADLIPVDAQIDFAIWDQDLEHASDDVLEQVLTKLRMAIQQHRDIESKPRTLEDDRVLYRVLPEKLTADFRLPAVAEFLGDAKAGAGCPAFWKSHQACPCKEHDTHRWGPCC